MKNINDFVIWLNVEYDIKGILRRWDSETELGKQCWEEAMIEYDTYNGASGKINMAELSQVIEELKNVFGKVVE